MRISGHAYQRMRERCVKRAGVTRALKSGTSATYRASEGTWSIESIDPDGDCLTIAVALKPAGDVVVTVFGGE